MAFYIFGSDIEAQQYKIILCCVSMAKILVFSSCFDARVIQTYKMNVICSVLVATLILIQNDLFVFHGMTMWEESRMQRSKHTSVMQYVQKLSCPFCQDTSWRTNKAAFWRKFLIDCVLRHSLPSWGSFQYFLPHKSRHTLESIQSPEQVTKFG